MRGRERLLAVYPEFPAKAREELARWVSPERRERTIDVLRRAGLLIPESDRIASPDRAGGARRTRGPGNAA